MSSTRAGVSAGSRSSTTRPGPASTAARPWMKAPAAAASHGAMPCASRPAISPASTSPEPAVASQGGADALIATRPSAAAMIVSAPFSSTTAPVRAAAARAAATPIGAGIAERTGKLARVRRQDGRSAQRLGLTGERGKHVGVSHHAAAGREQDRQGGAGCVRPEPRPAHPDVAPLVLQQFGQRCVADQHAGRAGTIDVAAAGRRDGHQAGAAAPRRIGRQPRRSGHRRAADHRDVAARILVRLRPRRRQAPQLRQVGEGMSGGPAAAPLRAGRCRPARSRRTARVQAAADGPASGGRTSPSASPAARSRAPRRWRRRARSAHPPRRRAARRATCRRRCRRRRAPGRRRTPHRSPGPRARASAGVNGAHRSMPSAMRHRLRRSRSRGGASAATATGQPVLLQQPRRHVAVAAVVAGAGQHQRAAWPESRAYRPRHRAAGIRHQCRSAAHPTPATPRRHAPSPRESATPDGRQALATNRDRMSRVDSACRRR